MRGRDEPVSKYQAYAQMKSDVERIRAITEPLRNLRLYGPHDDTPSRQALIDECMSVVLLELREEIEKRTRAAIEEKLRKARAAARMEAEEILHSVLLPEDVEV